MSDATPFDYDAACWGEDDVGSADRTIAAYRVSEALRFLPPSGRVLEVGCGAGRMLRAVHHARPSLALCGADVSQPALRRAAERSPAFEFRHVADARGPLPAADGEFDAVLLLDVLEHVEDPRAFLAEVSRSLRPGGVLHAHVPCEGDARSIWRWMPGADGPAGWKRRLAGHVQRFRRRDVLALLDAAGFDVLRTRHSLHVLGNLADVAAFASLARRARRGERHATTGDLLAGNGGGAGTLVRAVDRLLYYEAVLLGRIPSWGLHVSARRRAGRGD